MIVTIIYILFGDVRYKMVKINKKAAIGLSINTLVVVIISLVILGSGITMLYKFIGGAEDIKGQLDSKTNEELERLLVNQGERVALPLNSITIPKDEGHVFGKADFNIVVGLSKFINSNDEIVDIKPNEETEILDWLLYNDEPTTIAENEHHKESIMVNVPNTAVDGRYIFKAQVFMNGAESYGNIQKFYVIVK